MARRKRIRAKARPGVITKRSLTKLPRPINLMLIEDRRTYHPDRDLRPVRKLSGHPNQKTLIPIQNTKKYLPSSLAFADAGKVVLCVRRKIRKQVMFATGKAGKRGQRPPRRNFQSKVGC